MVELQYHICGTAKVVGKEKRWLHIISPGV